MAKIIIHLRDYELTALNDLAQREVRAPGLRQPHSAGNSNNGTCSRSNHPAQPDIPPADETVQLEMKGG